MKILAGFFVFCLLLIAVVSETFHSSWGKQKILSFLTQSLQESGWQVRAEKIDSLFPHFDLKGASIETEGLAISFDSLKADFSYLRLLKREVAFTDVQGDGVSWERKPLTAEPKALREKKPFFFALSIPQFSFTRIALFNASADMNGSLFAKEDRKGDLQIRSQGILHFREHPGAFHIKGQGKLTAKDSLLIAQVDVQSDQITELSPLAISGRLFAHVDLEEKETGFRAKASWRVPAMQIASYEASDVQGKCEASYADGLLEGTLSLNAHFLQNTWEANTLFSWEKETALQFSQIHVASAPVHLEGDLEITQDNLLIGQLQFTASQLHDVLPAFYGKAEGKMVWNIYDQEQIAHFDATASDFYWKEFSARNVSFYSDLGAEDSFFIDVEKGKWRSLVLESASLETVRTGANNPFKLFAEGQWNHPLVLEVDGFWAHPDSTFLVSLQTLSGSFFNHPLLLSSPAQVEWSPETFLVKDVALALGDASITTSIARKQTQTEAALKISRLPLDVLSLNPLDVAILGLLNLDATIRENGNRLQGDLKTTIENMSVQLLGEPPLQANGSFTGRFDKDELKLQGHLLVRETPLLDIDLRIPILCELWPFKAELIDDQPAKGRFLLSGRVEEFLDFFNLGTHRLEGKCLCDLTLSNTLAHPLLTGSCLFEDGYYQNYYTGTELQNVHARLLADKTALRLETLTAVDTQKKGTFTATGNINLLPKEHFPFHFDVAFTRFNCAAFDLITSEADGKLAITGNLEGALATGNLVILESDITIPNRIPREPPNLQVIYKNLSRPVEHDELPPAAPYPLHLDLQVDAPDGIFITGRGLTSEWKGHFHLQGTQTALETQGKIELVKGDFLFSGKEFKLTEGSLSFSGAPNAMPNLSLSANIEVKGVSITAQIKGPLNNPQVTFRSSPPLPMGTIMSYLLFGQDLAEINSFQALQLATSVASLAGEGPGVLERTRKSLGVDRIQIITVPNKNAEGGETIAVQVGKYVAEGVLVSFSQGADNSSSNITIDVDFKGGLSFQLASDQAQEQGKFALRWNTTY